MPKVAYQGIPGANSEIAARQHFDDDVDCVPCQDFNHLFDALHSRQVDYSLLPVENALAGSVSGAYEMLLDHDVRIQAEVILHVHHALLVNRGTTSGGSAQGALSSASPHAMQPLPQAPRFGFRRLV